jgi:molybdopterin converting factor subunit 1
MKVRIHLFAGVRAAIGQPVLELELPEGCTVGTLQELLSQRYPQAAPLLRSSVIAVNQQYAHQTTRLSEAQEIAIIPPVSGG